MQLTTFFLNGTKQITKLDRKFFTSEKNKDYILSDLELQQKARTTCMDIAGNQYYNHILEYERIDLKTEFTT